MYVIPCSYGFVCVFFNETATTEIYTLSLHDALPIYVTACREARGGVRPRFRAPPRPLVRPSAAVACHGSAARDPPPAIRRHPDRKSTSLNSSHANKSYAVFCLQKKKNLQHCEYIIQQ